MKKIKIFFDVGGNVGQTVAEMLKPIYRFDVIHSFEPQRSCYKEMWRKFASHLDGKVVLHNFGLADFDGERNLFGGGDGASIFADKRDIDNTKFEKCSFVCASTFIAEHIKAGDFAVMKMNCEGGELPILRNLMQSNAIHSLQAVFIDFDIRKIPSLQQEEKKIISELQAAGFTGYRTQSDLRRWHITTAERTNLWLSTIADAEHIMTLTTWQKFARCLPFSVRRYLQRRMRSLRERIYRACGNLPSD